MNWQKGAAVVTIVAGLIEIGFRLSTGAWLVSSWFVAAYGFIVSIPFLPPILTLTIGLIAGLYIGIRIGAADPPDSGSYPSRIYACLEINDVLWKARADLSNLSVSRLFVESDPYCPECNTVLDEDTVFKTGAPQTGIWECANCGFQTERESDTQNRAERIVERHYRQIATNQDEDYAYDKLVSRIEEEDREVTGESIWNKYVEIVGGEYLSMECFV